MNEQAKPDKRAELLDDIGRIVEGKIRAETLFLRMPTPVPIIAHIGKQRAIIATIWEGIAPPAELRAEHFYGRFWQLLFDYVVEQLGTGERPTVEHATEWISERGFPSPQLAAEIERAMMTPAVIPLRKTAADVIASAHQRQAAQHIARADALLSLVRVDAEHRAEITHELGRAIDALAGVDEQERPQ